jgi:GGDEF domain-containing protein
VLREAAQRIASCIRDGDLAARLGGDEFAAILQGSAAYPGPVAQRMIEAIGQPIAVHGRTSTLCEYRFGHLGCRPAPQSRGAID